MSFSSLQGYSVREVKVLGLELVSGLRLLNSINICCLLNIFSMDRAWRKYSSREVISNIPINLIRKIVIKIDINLSTSSHSISLILSWRRVLMKTSKKCWIDLSRA